MKGKNLEITVLLDFYGDILTGNQREMLDFYYNQDLSLSEIAETSGISRQGVRDAIKRGESQLFELEACIGAIDRHRKTQTALTGLIEIKHTLDALNKRICLSDLTDISDKLGEYTEMLRENDKID